MLRLDLSSKFKRDLKKIKKQRTDIAKLDAVIALLQNEKALPNRHQDHELVGNWRGYKECHISPDWLLIYKVVDGSVRLLRLSRTGSHSDLFK